ncbi:MAG: phosphoesterase [Candidatus Peribacteria bacterium]|nr:phosphoesterase [Candidatus Peribacteria bacterium]
MQRHTFKLSNGLAAVASFLVVLTAVSTGVYSLYQHTNHAAASMRRSAVHTTYPAPVSAAVSVPHFTHEVIILEENHDYAQVIGNPDMPFLNGLAKKYGLATNYYANTHPSIGNYFMLTMGKVQTNNDSYMSMVDADNIVRQLVAAGKTWKSYAEDLPSAGFTGPSAKAYARKHNPLSFFSDVVQNPTQKKNLVSATQFATDVKQNTLPDYSFVIPNLKNDGHDGPLATADTWLQKTVEPYLQSPAFLSGGLLVIAFDEAEHDKAHGGGKIPLIIASPFAKKSYTSNTLYQHQDTLRMMMEGLRLTQFPGAAATAQTMAEFFTSPMQ